MRIILADHHAQPRWALITALQEQPDIDLIGEAIDGQDLLTQAEHHAVDLVLVDRELPGLFIGDLITSLHALEPKPIVVVMSNDFEYSRVLLKAGADAFVSKGEPDWLLEKLHRYSEITNLSGG